MAHKASERSLCCQILAPLLHREGSLASALAPQLRHHDNLNGALIQELCYGVCRWYGRLHFVAQRLLDKPLRNKDSDVYCLILLGLYQLYFSRIPAHAALHETVATVELLGKPWATKLVNAVLREAQRQEASLLEAAQHDYTAWYAHPEWLLQRLKQDWPSQYRELLDANNARAPMTLRVNLARVTRSNYLEQLHAAGLPATPGQLSPAALVLHTPCDVQALPGFAEGLVSVQDEASQLVAQLLPLAPGLRVLDACAAPGGKTCTLLETEPTLRVLAADRDERRLPRLRENLARLQLTAEVRCLDLGQPNALPPASVDRILLDVPCSATGVIRRHPDIKLLRTPEEVTLLLAQQQALLTATWPLLRPGGFLLYSTCSVLRAENSQQVLTFANNTADASLQALAVPGVDAHITGLQLLPSERGPDGFFYALLQKC